VRSMEELVRAYREGDPDAQEELLTRMEDLLHRLVRKLMGTWIRSDRESIDVCQSLLLAFHLQAKDGKVDLGSEKALKAYLATMVRHKLANLSDHIRALKRGTGRRGVALDEEGFALPSHDPSASMAARASELRAHLEEALTQEEIEVFEGRLAGRTNQDIGERVGKSPDAVRMLWNRAREKLVERGVLERPANR
jgi:RNA polymerase sigma factor (sigma-70 family)